MLHSLLLTLGAALTLTAAPDEGTPAKVTGKLTNPPAPIAVLVGDSRRDTIALAADGSFSFSTHVAAPEFRMLYVPDSKLFLELFMENGTTNHVEGDPQNPQSVAVTGDLEAVYRFADGERAAFTAVSPTGEGGYRAYDERLLQVKDSLQQALAQVPSEGYRTYETRNLADMLDGMRLQFMHHLKGAGKPLDSDARFTAFMSSIRPDDPANLRNDRTIAYLYWKAACQGGNADWDYPAMMQLVKEEISDRQIADNVAYKLCLMYLGGGADAQLEKFYALAQELLSPESLAKVTPSYEKIRAFAPGSPAPDCELTLPDGSKVMFSSLQGKAVYLDIWATWCGPCRKEIPYMARLAEAYKDDPRISIVSISVDSNQKAWKALLDKDQPAWQQYLVPGDFRSPLLQMYGINGIPRFMMFDARGRIIDINAPRPSGEGIKEFIEGKLSLMDN